MIFKFFSVVLVLMVAGLAVAAQKGGFESRFDSAFKANDLARAQKVLSEWSKAAPEDPELYVAYFNFHLKRAERETLVISRDPEEKGAIRIVKSDDEKVVAYIGSGTYFETGDFEKSVEYIGQGIDKFPDRLDMRFGRIAALRYIRDYRRMTMGIVSAVERSAVNRNRWLWLKNKPVDAPMTTMLESIQSYVTTIFDAGDEHIPLIREIADAVLKVYPDNVENLSNRAVTHLILSEFDEALVWLQKAEKLRPGDFVVIGNIAYCYYKKGDKPNAVKYYEILLQIGSDDAKSQAREKLAELKKN